MRYGSVAATLTCLIAIFATGCGGGGGGVRAKVTLQWPQRSRNTLAPTSALSARITIQPENSGAQTILADRHADPAPYTDPRVGSTIVPGPATVTITFYAQPGQTGVVVAEGVAQVTVAADGSIPDLGVGGTVVFLDVPAGQTLMVGETRDLIFNARNSIGTVLALSPGSCFWTTPSGGASLRFDSAAAVALLPGVATVQANVDGIPSTPVKVKVTSNTTVTITTPNPTVAGGGNFTFAATVTGTGTGSTAVQWSIDEGAAGGTIGASTGVYTAPATPGVYHVVATSVYDPAKSATTTVTVQGGGVGVGGDFPPSGGVGVEID